MTMNLSKDGLRASHHEQKYFCSFCNFRTHKKYNLEVHKKNKHGTSQTSSGALLSGKTIPHHVPHEILHKNVVPIETYNHVSRQCQGWSSAYKNIEARNKQLEAQLAHVNACRDEDTNMFQQANQEVENHIQALEHANIKWQEYYSEKASKKHELIRVLTEYKTGCKNAAELKESIVRMIDNYL